MWLHDAMVNEGHAVVILTGEVPNDLRIETLTRFRNGTERATYPGDSPV